MLTLFFLFLMMDQLLQIKLVTSRHEGDAYLSGGMQYYKPKFESLKFCIKTNKQTHPF